MDESTSRSCQWVLTKLKSDPTAHWPASYSPDHGNPSHHLPVLLQFSRPPLLNAPSHHSQLRPLQPPFFANSWRPRVCLTPASWYHRALFPRWRNTSPVTLNVPVCPIHHSFLFLSCSGLFRLPSHSKPWPRSSFYSFCQCFSIWSHRMLGYVPRFSVPTLSWSVSSLSHNCNTYPIPFRELVSFFLSFTASCSVLVLPSVSVAWLLWCSSGHLYSYWLARAYLVF